MTRFMVSMLLIVGLIIGLTGCDKKEEMIPTVSEIEFVEDYQTALEKAQSSNQKVLVDFYTDWCSWCKVLDSVTYKDSAVIDLSGSIVFAKINAEVDTLTAQKYSVSGYPTIVLMEADGTEIDRIPGYQPPDEFILTINNYLQGVNTLPDLLNRAETEKTIDLYYELAQKYSGRGEYDEAVKYMNMVLEMDPKLENELAQAALISIGDIYTRAKHYDKAVTYFNEIMKKHKGTDFESQAMMSIGDAYLNQESFEKAIGQYNKVMDKFKGEDAELNALFRIGYIFRKELADTGKAIKIYENILKKFPAHDDTTYAWKHLRNLKPAEETAEH